MSNADPSVTGIVEAAMYVKDVGRAADFYQGLFGFEPELRNDLIAVLRVPGPQALILFAHAIAHQPQITPPNAIDGTIPSHGGTERMHVAFSIRAEELESWKKHLHGRGVPIEGAVRWKRGGTSLYFRDPDQHLVELITPGLWSFY